MKYFDTIAAVISLLEWKKTIIELCGPHSTEDSEIMLCKMVKDVVQTNECMKIFKKCMIDMIYFRDLSEMHFCSDDVEHTSVWVS